MFDDKVLLITGGTGSFGSTVLRRFINEPFKEIRIFSRDETKQEDQRLHYRDSRLRYYLGDVRDTRSIGNAVKDVDYIFHAAALKQVATGERFPAEVVRTNILGTENVCEASAGRLVVLLSTDKAVEPTNAYGASKMLAEHLTLAAGGAVVRYGNVLGSRGSVLHTWRQQMAAGRPITLTHPDISRFWMTAPQAVGLVLTALARMEGGEIFVPKLPALQLSALARLVGGPDHPTTLTGLRPGGEKLHEELLSGEEIARTHDGGDVYIIAPTVASWRSVAPDYGPLVDPAFRYRSDTAPVMSDAEMTLMLEAA